MLAASLRTGTTTDKGSTAQNGMPSFRVISAEEYAPSPMNAACPMESCPTASTTYMDRASSPLMPREWTRFW